MMIQHATSLWAVPGLRQCCITPTIIFSNVSVAPRSAWLHDARTAAVTQGASAGLHVGPPASLTSVRGLHRSAKQPDVLNKTPKSCPGRQPQHARARRVTCNASAASLPAGGGGGSAWPLPAAAGAALRDACRALAAAAARAVDAHFLSFCLLAGAATGCAFPAAGAEVAKLDVSSFVTFCMFVISGVQLKQKQALEALKAKGALLYGLVSVLLVTPLMSLGVLRLPLDPPELSLGLAVFCCMPTALSSGITFTQAVRGNVAVALLLTVASNLLGVFTMPLMLPALLGDSLRGAGLEALPLLERLTCCVLLPTAVGASLRALVPGAAAFVDARHKPLARLSAVLLALVPWTQVSKTVAQGVLVAPGSLALALVAGISVHLVFLALNTAACSLLNLGGAASSSEAALGVRRAVILTASSKTLPVAVAVFSSLAPALGGMVGVALVPAMAAHLSQIMIDSGIASWWLSEARNDLGAGGDLGKPAAGARALAEAGAGPAPGGGGSGSKPGAEDPAAPAPSPPAGGAAGEELLIPEMTPAVAVAA